MGTFIKSDFRSTDTTAPRVRSAYAVDTFNRANSGTLGTTEVGGYAWVTSYGGSNTGSIVSNTAQLSNTVGGGTARIDDGRTDGMLTVKLVEFTRFTGVCFRGTAGTTTEYVVYGDGTSYRFARKTGADSYTDNVALPGSPVPSPGDVLSVTMAGPEFTIRVNGAVVSTHTDSTYTGNTKGLFARGTTSRFDDFRWDPLP